MLRTRSACSTTSSRGGVVGHGEVLRGFRPVAKGSGPRPRRDRRPARGHSVSKPRSIQSFQPDLTAHPQACPERRRSGQNPRESGQPSLGSSIGREARPLGSADRSPGTVGIFVIQDRQPRRRGRDRLRRTGFVHHTPRHAVARGVPLPPSPRPTCLPSTHTPRPRMPTCERCGADVSTRYATLAPWTDSDDPCPETIDVCLECHPHLDEGPPDGLTSAPRDPLSRIPDYRCGRHCSTRDRACRMHVSGPWPPCRYHRDAPLSTAPLRRRWIAEADD